MTNDQIKKDLEVFFSVYRAVQVNVDLLSKISGFSFESDFGRALDEMQMDYQKLMSERIGGDCAEWISWYIHENNFGARAMQAGFPGGLRLIVSVDDLIWAMTSKRPLEATTTK